MPKIQMPEKEPQPNEVIPDTGKPSDKDIIDQIQEDTIDSVDDNSPLIEVTERVIPEEEDVFGEPPTPSVPKVKPIKPQEEEEGDPNEEPCPSPQQELEFKPTGKRKYTRKAPMSQKQKDHLARIRQIASEKRAKERELKAQEKIKKEEEKEEARIRKAEERLLAKQKKEAQQRHEKINNVNEPVMPKVHPQPQTGFTREDMEKAMFSAIASYETIRKKEKEEKKKREIAEAREKQMHRTLQQAIQPQSQPDPWRQYFA